LEIISYFKTFFKVIFEIYFYKIAKIKLNYAPFSLKRNIPQYFGGMFYIIWKKIKKVLSP